MDRRQNNKNAKAVSPRHCAATSVLRSCTCDSALAQRLKQQLRSTLVAAQWRGDTALTLPLFLGRSTASSVFRVGARGQSSPHSLVPRTPSPVFAFMLLNVHGGEMAY